jgi:hypothetical protein
MAKEMGLSQSTVSRIWRAFGLQPHRLETFKLSTDSSLVDKVHGGVGLYLDPPERALVFCVDEKSQIQALDRSQPVLPMMPGVPQRITHDYVRAGRHHHAARRAGGGHGQGDRLTAPPAQGPRSAVRIERSEAVDVSLLKDRFGAEPVHQHCQGADVLAVRGVLPAAAQPVQFLGQCTGSATWMADGQTGTEQ